MIEVPEIVRAKAATVGAHAWVEAVPTLATALAKQWSLTLGPVLSGGTESVVLEVGQQDGTPAVLKLHAPRTADAAAREATVLRHADGYGCVRLLRADTGRDAFLLERLGPSLAELQLPLRRRQQLLCDTAQHVWRPVADSGLPTGADHARWLADWIPTTWEHTHQPCSPRVLEHALACAHQRITAHDDDRAVLVHGDVQQWNLHQTPAGGFKLIDPEGLLAEPEYDLGVLMREDPVALLQGDPYARAQWLAARTGCDATAIWEWGVLERVSTGLLATQLDLQPAGRHMLATAETLAVK